MPGGTYYVQECPTCGRSLQVRVEYLGKDVACRHCGAKFEACDPSSGGDLPMESGISLLARADELIESATRSASAMSGTDIGSASIG